MYNPKILIITTGTGTYAGTNLATGLWLSEYTQIYHCAKGSGYEITIANPKGGDIPVDPESLKPIVLDRILKEYWKDPIFKNMLYHVMV